MGPKKEEKGKGKGKGKGKWGGSSSRQGEEGVRSTHIFDIILDDLRNTYQRTMTSIPVALRGLLVRLAPKKRNNKTRLRRVHKKLYTLNGGSFMIRIMPTKLSPVEDHLMLLFRWSDLYYVAYNCKGVWYRLADELKEDLPLPPSSQVFYKIQKGRGVVDLPFGTSYAALGGTDLYYVYAGPKSFQDLYEALMQTAELKEQGRLNDLFRLCQMAPPPVAFSEASRFGQVMGWVLGQTSLAVDNKGEERTPEEYAKHFNSWGSDSLNMFTSRDGQAPEGVAARLSILKTPGTTVKIPLTRGPHEKGSSSSEEDA